MNDETRDPRSYSLSVKSPRLGPDGYILWSERLDTYLELINTRLAKKSISILEIGVLRASLTLTLFEKLSMKIERYVGVDPYIGDESDPYFAAYWKKDKKIAEKTFDDTAKIFKDRGAELVRATSLEYFDSTREQFDLVIIDGDHRAEPALKDLRAGWKLVKPNGLILLDDFGNPDHPGVTTAGLAFDKEVAADAAECGCAFTFFQKAGTRLFAFPLGIAWWRSNGRTS